MSRILVKEDEHDIRDLIEQTLQMLGYDVLIAENGKIGVSKAKELLPDLILCDINMPELDGYGVISEIRKDKTTSTIPFIFLTARIEKKDLREGMNLGADDFLNKPFTIEELKLSIEKRLEKSDIIRAKEEEKIDDLKLQISLSLPHELRTPLTTIIGFADLFVNDFDSLSRDEVNQYSQAMLENANRLNKTLEKYLLYTHLLFLSKNRSHLTKLRNSKTQITEDLVKSCIQYKLQLLDRANDLQLDIEEKKLNIHNDYLMIIIEQIGNNCFDFSENGSNVQINGSEIGSNYILTFKDCGRGIKEEQIKNIGAFVQFDRQFYEQQGTGMGLTLAKLIIEIFEGEIQFQSEIGKGTTVIVKLKALND